MNLTVSTLRRLLALALVGAAAVTAVVLLGGGEPTSAADPEPSGPAVNPIEPPGTPTELAAQFESGFALLRAPGGSSIPATVGIDDPSLRRRRGPPARRRRAPAPLARAAGDETPRAAGRHRLGRAARGRQPVPARLPAEEEETLGGSCIWPPDALAGRLVMTQSRDRPGRLALRPDARRRRQRDRSRWPTAARPSCRSSTTPTWRSSTSRRRSITLDRRGRRRAHRAGRQRRLTAIARGRRQGRPQRSADGPLIAPFRDPHRSHGDLRFP